ncbi:MAG: IS21-like element helper ATPase IstB [Candidatus Methanomethylophilaceae archaeon]|jgi:DNA replication protein DnaC
MDHCRALKLGGIRGCLDAVMKDASTQKWSYDRFLAELLSREAEHKENTHRKAQIKKAGFPQLKYLEDLDRDCLPKDMAVALPELEALDFIKTGQNVIMYGNPGTGKTHCAIGLGIKACLAGYNVLYASVPRLLVQIKECESQRKLSRLQKRFEKYDLAILDECGYKSFDKAGAELLFNHISLRAGIKSIIITTNLGFDKWDQIFTDKIIAAAIVDRLTYKSYIVDMNAQSYRIKATEEWIKERKMKQKTEK